MVRRLLASRPGFTLIEGLLAITVVALVSGVTIPLYLNYQVNSDLNLAMEQATQGLRRAQLLSQSGEGDSVWGFYVPSGTLYKGQDYEARDVAADEVYPMPSTITVSGSILEVAYSREGTPSQVGTITLTDIYGEQRLITITIPEVGIPTNESDYVTICHCSGGSCRTITVSDSVWPAHQTHGDTLNACPGAPASSAASSAPASSAASSAVSSAASSVASSTASSAASSAAGGGETSQERCERRFILDANGKITTTGPVNVAITVLGSQITYGAGGPEINVYVSYSKNNGQSWRTLFSGKDVDGGETQTVGALVEGDTMLIRVQGYYKHSGWLTFDRTYTTPDASGHLVMLRNGDTPPNYPAFSNQASLASYLRNLLNAQGKISISQYEAVLIGEIGVQNLSASTSAVDFQDIVLKFAFTQNGSCN